MSRQATRLSAVLVLAVVVLAAAQSTPGTWFVTPGEGHAEFFGTTSTGAGVLVNPNNCPGDVDGSGPSVVATITGGSSSTLTVTWDQTDSSPTSLEMSLALDDTTVGSGGSIANQLATTNYENATHTFMPPGSTWPHTVTDGFGAAMLTYLRNATPPVYHDCATVQFLAMAQGTPVAEALCSGICTSGCGAGNACVADGAGGVECQCNDIQFQGTCCDVQQECDPTCLGSNTCELYAPSGLRYCNCLSSSEPVYGALCGQGPIELSDNSPIRQQFLDSVASNAMHFFFESTVAGQATITLLVESMTNDVSGDVDLYYRPGQAVMNKLSPVVVQAPSMSGTGTKTISQNLPPGLHYIRVEQTSSGCTDAAADIQTTEGANGCDAVFTLTVDFATPAVKEPEDEDNTLIYALVGVGAFIGVGLAGLLAYRYVKPSDGAASATSKFEPKSGGATEAKKKPAAAAAPAKKPKKAAPSGDTDIEKQPLVEDKGGEESKPAAEKKAAAGAAAGKKKSATPNAKGKRAGSARGASGKSPGPAGKSATARKKSTGSVQSSQSKSSQRSGSAKKPASKKQMFEPKIGAPASKSILKPARTKEATKQERSVKVFSYHSEASPIDEQ